jgi:hypothetical protein
MTNKPKEEEKSQCCDKCSDLSQSYKMPCVNTDCKCHISTPEESTLLTANDISSKLADKEAGKGECECACHGADKKRCYYCQDNHNNVPLPQPKDSWEERFEKFGHEEDLGCKEGHCNCFMKYIKSFIGEIRKEGIEEAYRKGAKEARCHYYEMVSNKAHLEERTRLIEKIEGMEREKVVSFSSNAVFDRGFNRALSDIISSLKKE